MSQQSIILPSAPLLIVHKGWQRAKGKENEVKKSADGQGQFRIGEPRRPLDDISVTVMKQHPTQGVANGERSRPKSKSGTASKPNQDWQFVNATKPLRNRDPEVRKLVRSHVMKSYHGDTAVRRKPRKPKVKAPIVSFNISDLIEEESNTTIETSLSLVPSGSAASLYGGGFPFIITPHSHKLMNYYLSTVAQALYPLQHLMTFNPAKTFWFPLAITDEVLFQTFLYVSALNLSMVPGVKLPALEDPSALMKPIFGLLGKRLEDISKVSDATIGAVSCLAMVENALRNGERWNTHLAGMAEMIRMKGGLSAINEPLQMKICRADIEGAVDTVSTPHLTPLKRTQPPIYSMLPPSEISPPSNDLLQILVFSSLDPQLINTFIDLSRFTQALNYAVNQADIYIHPRAFDEDMILVQYELLGLPNSEKNETQEACRLGALLYVKSLTRGDPFAPKTSATIVRKLKLALHGVPAETRVARLDLWLLYMGGIASQGSSERTWFIYKLAELAELRSELVTWNDVEKALSSILWVDLIHKSPCKQLWEDVEKLRSILYPQSVQ